MITPSEFIHPEDAAALQQLENIPGFPTLVKKVLELGLEPMRHGMNMASCIRLSPTQLPQLYNHLPPICQRLGTALIPAIALLGYIYWRDKEKVIEQS